MQDAGTEVVVEVVAEGFEVGAGGERGWEVGVREGDGRSCGATMRES